MSKVGVIGDLHAPAILPRYLEFCQAVFKKHRVNKYVLIGDVIDCEAIKFHPADPDMPGVHDEMEAAREQLTPWYNWLRRKEVYVCRGNHDDRVHRAATGAGIPRGYMRDHADIIGTPSNWEWVEEVEIDGVMYLHGDGRGGGVMPAKNMAASFGQPVVAGHFHSVAGIHSFCGQSGELNWGMQVGCGADASHPCMKYGKRHNNQPVYACGVVIDGQPIVYYMNEWLRNQDDY